MKYLLLYNPASGKGKIKKQIPLIKKIFEEKNLSLDICESKQSKDLLNQAFLLSDKYDTYIIAGGDGTVNEVINGVMKADKKPAIAIIPTGTANDIASILGMKKNIKKSIDIILNSTTVLMDVNQMNDQYFIYTGSAGIFTSMSYATKRKFVKAFGMIAYFLTGVKDAFKKHMIPLKIKTEHVEIEGTFELVLGLSANRVAGIFLKRFYRNKLNDGQFEIRLFKRRGFFGLLSVLLFFITLGGSKSKSLTLSASEYDIQTSDDVAWNIDGEYSTKGSIKIKVHQEQIKVYLTDKRKKRYF